MISSRKREGMGTIKTNKNLPDIRNHVSLYGHENGLDEEREGGQY